jgi:hypothetical protein
MRNGGTVCVALIAVLAVAANAAERVHPRLLLTPADAQMIRAELDPASGFGRSLAATKARVDSYFANTPDVPLPVDPGGGYTHEKH